MFGIGSGGAKNILVSHLHFKRMQYFIMYLCLCHPENGRDTLWLIVNNT